jgi:hypothetical protein
MPRALVALLLAAATGMALSTIGRGLKELGEEEAPGRVRRPGAGRKPAIAKDPTLMSDLEALVEPTTRGDPDWPLRWTCAKAPHRRRRSSDCQLDWRTRQGR